MEDEEAECSMHGRRRGLSINLCSEILHIISRFSHPPPPVHTMRCCSRQSGAARELTACHAWGKIRYKS